MRLVEHRGAAKLATALFAHAGGQVASARFAVLRLAGAGKPEPLFRAFVSLLLGHNCTLGTPARGALLLFRCIGLSQVSAANRLRAPHCSSVPGGVKGRFLASLALRVAVLEE